MTVRQPCFSKEEFQRRGSELYDRILPQVEAGNRGKVVAIDIETGAFAVAGNTVEASQHLLSRRPDAQTWFVRIGHRSLHRFGPRSLRCRKRSPSG